MSLFVVQSNRLEYLAEILTRFVAKPESDEIFAREVIMIPSHGMRQYLEGFFAQKLGVTGNINYRLPASFAWELNRVLMPNIRKLNPFSAEVLQWRLFALFQSDLWCDSNFHFSFQALTSYLKQGDVATLHLAGQLAKVFDQYLVYRPDWILQWESGGFCHANDQDELWQRELWQWLKHTEPAPHRIDQQKVLREKLSAQHLPKRLFVFGIATMAPVYLELIKHIGKWCDVYLFALNPSQQFWADIRSLKESGTLSEHSDEALQNNIGNPLLASLGVQGRYFFRELAALESVEVYDQAEDLANNKAGHKLSLLQQIQLDIQQLNMSAPPEISGRHFENDHSIHITSAHSPVRELHVLKDYLWRLLDENPNWQASDIAVLTPNIERYLPYLHAILGSETAGSGALPYSVADVRIKQQHPLLQLLSKWLTWVDSRGPIDQLLQLAQNEAMREKFELDNNDLQLLKTLLQRTNTCWGLDASMRQHFGGADDAFTLLRLQKRLTLGLLMQDNTLNLWAGVAPWHADLSLDNAVQKILRFIQALSDEFYAWQSPAPLETWIKRIHTTLETIAPTQQTAHAAAMRYLGELLESWQEAALPYFAGSLSRGCWLSHLKNHLETTDSIGFLKGGITFCTMLPMRSLPFRAICLIGLNDGEYPRAAQTTAFDLMSRYPRAGDRARRDDDRYLFLESIISAREKLYLSYVGRDIRKNEALAPSTLIYELCDTIAHMTGKNPSQLNDLIVDHPLQAFSRRYFVAGSPSSYRQDFARALNEAAQGARKPVNQVNDTTCTKVNSTDEPRFCEPPQRSETLQVAFENFVSYWKNPSRFRLLNDFGLKNHYSRSAPSSSEMFDLAKNSNESQASREANGFLLQLFAESSEAPSNLQAILQARNWLPEGKLGDLNFTQHYLSAWQKLQAFNAQLLDPIDFSLNFELPAGAVTLSGTLSHLTSAGQLLPLQHAPYRTSRINALLHHLVLCAVSSAATVTLYPHEPQMLPAIKSPVAYNLLRDWLLWYENGQHNFLPFFAKTSLAAANKFLKSKQKTFEEKQKEALNAAKVAYEGGFGSQTQGDGQKMEARYLFAGLKVAPYSSDYLGGAFFKILQDTLIPSLQALENKEDLTP